MATDEYYITKSGELIAVVSPRRELDFRAEERAANRTAHRPTPTLAERAAWARRRETQQAAEEAARRASS